MNADVTWQATGLPTWATPFVGREPDIRRLESLLATPDRRLITLLGPGGVGKSRLATEVARAAAAQMPVAFVSAEQADDLELALVEQLEGVQDRVGHRAEQLAAFFGDDLHLLVLDNLEHLVQQADLTELLLGQCPGLRILVTSREVLGLGQEWVVPLHGLAYPAPGASDPAAQYEAMRLIVDRIEQASGHRVGADELADASRICALTDGLPLALELAASWSRSLSLREIADELEQSTSLLTARGRSVNERHRSIRVVVEQSWYQLTTDEQTIFARLGIFSGGFTREAAIAVTGTDVYRLASLIEKSLVQREETGRYRLHPLMLEFALEQLRSASGAESKLDDAHARYYLQFLHERRSEIDSFHQVEAVRAIRREWNNVRKAWTYALACGWEESITDALYTIFTYTCAIGNYPDSLDWARRAIERFPEPHRSVRLQFYALMTRTWVNVRLGNLSIAEEAAREADAILASGALPVERGLNLDPLTALGVISLARGAFLDAEQWGAAALERAHSISDGTREALALYVLENAAFEQGQYEEAERLTRAAFVRSERAGDRWFMAYLHNDLGRSALLRGDRDGAEQHFRESLAIRTDFGDIGGTALAEQHLADIEAARGDLRGAEQRLRRCLRLFSQARDRGAMAQVLTALGRVAVARGRPSAAAELLAQALSLAREADLTPLAMEILVEAGQPGVLAEGTSGEALRLLALAAAGGQTSEDIRAAAERAIERSGCRPAEVAEARRWARAASPEPVLGAVAEALRERSRRIQASEPDREPVPRPVERLSERESEVLDLLAEGWSNERIGRHLGLRLGTVKWHTNQLYGKLGVSSRTEAVAAARRLGLLN